MFDITARFERREQTKNIVFVQFEPFAKLGHTDFVDIAIKLLQHVERMRNGLNNIIGFLPPNHVSSLDEISKLRRFWYRMKRGSSKKAF